MARYEELTVGQLVPEVFTTATLPSNNARRPLGAVVAVSDAGAGDNYTLVINNGTDWIDITTGAAVVA